MQESFIIYFNVHNYWKTRLLPFFILICKEDINRVPPEGPNWEDELEGQFNDGPSSILATNHGADTYPQVDAVQEEQEPEEMKYVELAKSPKIIYTEGK